MDVSGILEKLGGLFTGIKLASQSVPNWFVVVMGMGTVFVGLICIIILCKIVGFFCKGDAANTSAEAAKGAATGEESYAQPENKQEIIAAVTAACAEAMGKDIKALRVVSFKKI